MKIIYNSKFQNVSIEHTGNIFTQTWYSSSDELDDETYKHEILDLGNTASEHLIPPKGLIDLTDFRFVISPELQEWHNRNIFQPADGYTHMAVVAPREFISHLSVEQTFDDGLTAHLDFDVRYFEGKEEALEWLTYA